MAMRIEDRLVKKRYDDNVRELIETDKALAMGREDLDKGRDLPPSLIYLVGDGRRHMADRVNCDRVFHLYSREGPNR